MVTERVVEVAVPREERREEAKISRTEREIRVEIPADMELSEEELRKVAHAAENEIVDVARGAQATALAAKSVIKIEIKIVIK